ncbi:hypothetical protein JZU68_01455, partial [bacterium]|nr:hypothetical protein [bacterium]
ISQKDFSFAANRQCSIHIKRIVLIHKSRFSFIKKELFLCTRNNTIVRLHFKVRAENSTR